MISLRVLRIRGCRSLGPEVSPQTALPVRIMTVTAGKRKVPVQLFQDPIGERYLVITLVRASVHKHWPAEGDFWFPGYSWMLGSCPRCRAHLGWAYQPRTWRPHVTDVEFEDSDGTFASLITDNSNCCLRKVYRLLW
ncbi:urocortin-3-like [Platysternon megacephalum]|uniref:Urocortin-3-like n=1 Tax=Platysternon megacephalum TaxID=55544 RepID=A0A4D9EQF6_9SAUR|nr:urocortin-3-like [Platysternon megacephalum]